ncbi:MAG: type II toxin-antitoxin system RelE/ParE family toxin [Candidatus Omnitrophica bacterium]|nr:type II toxin-antitoxin system RelE/ParE family toxin [Candidatus Omnitrophota bacterium]
MTYRVVFRHPAIQKHFEKALKKIPPSDQESVMEAILKLHGNPRPQQALKLNPPLELSGLMAHYRLRVGDYRVFYDIDDMIRLISVIALRRRNESTYRS